MTTLRIFTDLTPSFQSKREPPTSDRWRNSKETIYIFKSILMDRFLAIWFLELDNQQRRDFRIVSSIFSPSVEQTRCCGPT